MYISCIDDCSPLLTSMYFISDTPWCMRLLWMHSIFIGKIFLCHCEVSQLAPCPSLPPLGSWRLLFFVGGPSWHPVTQGHHSLWIIRFFFLLSGSSLKFALLSCPFLTTFLNIDWLESPRVFLLNHPLNLGFRWVSYSHQPIIQFAFSTRLSRFAKKIVKWM